MSTEILAQFGEVVRMRRPDIPCTPESIAAAKADNTRQRTEFAHVLIEHGDLELARKLELPLDEASQRISDIDTLWQIVDRQGWRVVVKWVSLIRSIGRDETIEHEQRRPQQ